MLIYIIYVILEMCCRVEKYMYWFDLKFIRYKWFLYFGKIINLKLSIWEVYILWKIMMKKVDIIICWMYVEVEEENDIYNFIYILVLIK